MLRFILSVMPRIDRRQIRLRQRRREMAFRESRPVHFLVMLGYLCENLFRHLDVIECFFTGHLRLAMCGNARGEILKFVDECIGLRQREGLDG